jgi:hypothetical protein
MRRSILLAVLLACALGAATVTAATYQGRRVDGRWYEGRAVSNSFGAYECQIKFDDDRVLLKVPAAGIQIVAFLEDEMITDAHDITVYDPRRGVYWTLDVFNLGS